MKLLGMTYTSDDKETAIGELRELGEVTFLKRSFRFSEIIFRHVAPLNLASIVDMLNWTTRGPQENIIVDSNVQTALQELSLHDKTTFDNFSKKILDAVDRARLQSPKCANYLGNHLMVSVMESKY
jgi:hypothetical protein